MSRRVLSLLLLTTIMAFVALPTVSAKGKRMPRQMRSRYVSMGYNYVASSSERPIEYNLLEPLQVDVEKGERWAAITIEDVTTRSVGAEITQDVDRDGTPDAKWEVCGKTRAPMRIAEGKGLTITLLTGSCSDEPGTATSGTVHIDLYSPAPKPPATSGPRVERTFAFSYTGWLYQSGNLVAFGGVRVDSWPSEAYVEISATDASGLPTHVHVQPEEGRSFDVCGASDEPIAIEPGTELRISVWPEPCSDGRPAAMTSGEIEVTLSNLP
jgi:hypothetical protein